MAERVDSCFIPDSESTSQVLVDPFMIDTEHINAWILNVRSRESVQTIPENHKSICNQHFIFSDHMNPPEPLKIVEIIETKEDEEPAENNAEESPEEAHDESPDELSQHLSSLTVSQPRDNPDDLDVSLVNAGKETEISEDFIDFEDISSEDLNSILKLISEDVVSVCRLCGKTTDDPLPIFSGDEENEISLFEKIQYYLPIKLDANDNLPKVICRECKEHLEKSHELAMTSLATEALLTGSALKEDLIEKTMNDTEEDVLTITTNSDQVVTSTGHIQVVDNKNVVNCSQETVSDGVYFDCSQTLITSDEDESPFTTFEALKVRRTYGKKRPLSLGDGSSAAKKKKEEPVFETWYKCNMCVASSRDKEVMKFHKHRHRLRKPVLFWCNFCATEFSKESIFANHILSVHKKESRDLSQAFKCIICHRVFSLMTAAVIHYQTTCAVDPVKEGSTRKCSEDVYVRYAYTCEFCWEGYAYVSSLNMHRNQKHPETNHWIKGTDISEDKKRERIMDMFGIKCAFVCKFCGKIFISLENYVHHQVEHADGLFRCSICYGTFGDYQDFRLHRETQHDFRIVLRETSGGDQLDENKETASSFEIEITE
ncbi:myoneurin-like [Diachasmimorpha longicaudata]|uniref:myoneurin-like n=1 Tax=Diachasmimorpha longicaudata TaxID=58733 RepID=UPI0030B90C2E